MDYAPEGGAENQDGTRAATKDKVLLLPELSQAQISALMRLEWCYADYDSKANLNDPASLESTLQQVLVSFSSRFAAVDMVYGQATSDGRVFARGLMALSEQDYRDRARLVGALRLIPGRHHANHVVETWRRDLRRRYPRNKLPALADKYALSRFFRF